jgi:hypothetical protein
MRSCYTCRLWRHLWLCVGIRMVKTVNYDDPAHIQKLSAFFLMCRKVLPRLCVLWSWNVNLSLCLINWSQRHEDLRGSGGTITRLFNLVSRWRSMVIFTLRPLYPRGKIPMCPFDRSLTEPHTCLCRYGEKPNPLSLPEIEPRFFVFPAGIQSYYRLLPTPTLLVRKCK